MMHFWFWKHNKQETPVIISHDDYEKLPAKHKQHFEKATGNDVKPTYQHTKEQDGDDEGDFGLSLLAGMATDNAAVGYIAGGHLGGAMLGAMLADAGHQQADIDGGSGGGAGATGSFDSPAVDSSPCQVDNSSYDSSSISDSSSSSFDSGSSGGCDNSGGN